MKKKVSIVNEKITTRAGFEPARAEPKGTCIPRLNHSAIVSSGSLKQLRKHPKFDRIFSKSPKIDFMSPKKVYNGIFWLK